MLDRALFALGFGVGAPSFLWAVGADLPADRLAAWGVVGFVLGWALPTGLDWLYQWGKAEEISLIAARDANTEMTLAHAAEIRARLAVPVEVEPVRDYAADWRQMFHRFVTAGALHGFKVRDLGAGPHKVVEWEDWAVYREPLIDAGVLEARGGTRWAEGWTWERWQKEGAALPLPFPKGAPPPVALTVTTAQKQPKQQVLVDTEGVAA